MIATQQPNRTRRRLLVWASVTTVVVASMPYYYFFLRLPSPGSGPAGPAVDRSRFADVWSDEPIVVLGVGDSVTAGYGASTGKSYFERLIRNPDGEFEDLSGVCLQSVFPKLIAINVAESGSNSIQCLENQLPKLKPYPANTRGVVAITTGGNDLIHWYGRAAPKEGAMYGATMEDAQPWINAFTLRMDEIVERARGLFPGGCDIFLANIYDPSDGLGKPEAIGMPPWDDMVPILAAYNEVIAACAQRHADVHLVDIHAPFLGHGVRCRQPWREHYHADDPHYWYHENIEDPNDRGYDALRRVFLNAMANVFAKAG